MARFERKILPLALLGCCLAVGLAAAASAQEADGPPASAWTVGAEFDLNGRYIWRSLVWNDKPVWQPSVWIGHSGWTLSAWSNLVLGREPNRGRFSEIDLQLSYEMGFGPFTLAPALTVYAYPYAASDDSPTTGEIEIQVALPLGPLTLETSHFLDFWKNPGGYVGEVGCEYETGLAACLTFDAAARLVIANSAFNRYYIPYDRGAVHAIVLELGWTLQVDESVTVRPHVEWNRLLDSRVRAAVAGSSWVAAGRASVFNIGLAVAFERGLRNCP